MLQKQYLCFVELWEDDTSQFLEVSMLCKLQVLSLNHIYLKICKLWFDLQLNQILKIGLEVDQWIACVHRNLNPDHFQIWLFDYYQSIFSLRGLSNKMDWFREIKSISFDWNDRIVDLFSKIELIFMPDIFNLGVIKFIFVIFCIIHTQQLRSIWRRIFLVLNRI